jgi:5-methylcytosine-specific restriction endonuclease McrA
MLPCRHRLMPEAESYCWLETSRRTEEETSLVFQGEGESRPVKCTAPLATVCPFREWTERTEKAGLVPCPHCRHRHREGSNSQLLCEAWGSTKGILAQLRKELPEGRRFYEQGTTVLPYDDHTTSLVRRLVWQRLKNTVLRRDRYRCQDCGAEFGARRRKVFDRRLRRGRGGYRWESLEVHHIIARSQGGSDHPGNLKSLCPACHREYTSEQAVERTALKRERRDTLRSLEQEGYGEETVEDPRD